MKAKQKARGGWARHHRASGAVGGGYGGCKARRTCIGAVSKDEWSAFCGSVLYY